MPRNSEAKKEKAAFLIASGKSIAETAKEVEVHQDTISEWKRLETFKRLVNQKHKELFGEISKQLTKAAHDSVKFLQEIVVDDSQPTRLRITAADKLLSHAEKFNQVELLDRIEQLENCLEEFTIDINAEPISENQESREESTEI